MPRRGAFDDWKKQADSTASVPPPPTPLSQMNVAKPRQRSREWEKGHRTYSYRGVPPELHEQVIALASHLQVNTDDVVQVFVHFGISCLSKGILTISPRPKAQRMTLFPLPSGWGEQAGWSEAADGWEPPHEIPTKQKTAKREKSLWENFVHYRLSIESHKAIKRLAEQHTIPIGEIVTLFLKHGLEAYKTGHLRLNPQPRTVKMTLLETHP